jgi:cytochrome oxidase assembly protein ShyY1
LGPAFVPIAQLAERLVYTEDVGGSNPSRGTGSFLIAATYCQCVLETLRSRRYLGLVGATFAVALICVAAGTWQIARFDWKRNANHHLRVEDHAQVVAVAAALGPAAGSTSNGASDQYRQVSATGQYLNTREVLVRGQSVGDEVGYLVLTPFQTSEGVLLVARGFIPQTQQATATPVAPTAPTGIVTITTRLRPAATRPDRLGALPSNQVLSINAAEQQARLGQPVWNGYGELLAGQPGAANLTAIPGPDLSNPAGGAAVPQHAAYVVQWYLFAGLALALPFVLAAAERRRDLAEGRDQGAVDEQPEEPDRLADETDETGKSQPSQKRRKPKKASLDDRLAGNV